MPPLLAVIVSGALVALLLRSRVASYMLDHPNKRSLHAAPVPRLGGVGIVGGVAAAWGYAQPDIDPWLLTALGILICVSLYDDVRGAGVAWRLLIHVASAVLLAVTLLRGDAWWLIACVTLATVWMINLYNFMDGADGLAGGMTVIGFGSYGIAALAGGDFSFAALNLSVAAAALGFLPFNFPPARVFMGDGGAIPLGFLAAAFDILGWQRGDWPWWFGIVIFSPFIVDATLTLSKRLARGAKIWQPHREHYYQRLVRNGWGHRRTALAEYGLMAITGGVAFMVVRLAPAAQYAVVITVALFYTALIVLLECYLGRHTEHHV